MTEMDCDLEVPLYKEMPDSANKREHIDNEHDRSFFTAFKTLLYTPMHEFIKYNDLSDLDNNWLYKFDNIPESTTGDLGNYLDNLYNIVDQSPYPEQLQMYTELLLESFSNLIIYIINQRISTGSFDFNSQVLFPKLLKIAFHPVCLQSNYTMSILNEIVESDCSVLSDPPLENPDVGDIAYSVLSYSFMRKPVIKLFLANFSEIYNLYSGFKHEAYANIHSAVIQVGVFEDFYLSIAKQPNCYTSDVLAYFLSTSDRGDPFLDTLSGHFDSGCYVSMKEYLRLLLSLMDLVPTFRSLLAHHVMQNIELYDIFVSYRSSPDFEEYQAKFEMLKNDDSLMDNEELDQDEIESIIRAFSLDLCHAESDIDVHQNENSSDNTSGNDTEVTDDQQADLETEVTEISFEHIEEVLSKYSFDYPLFKMPEEYYDSDIDPLKMSRDFHFKLKPWMLVADNIVLASWHVLYWMLVETEYYS